MNKFKEIKKTEFDTLNKAKRISGPVSVSKFILDDKEIYIFGDYHINNGIKCSGESTSVGINHLPIGNKNGECSTLNFAIYEFVRHRKKYYPQDYIDLYVESPYFTDQVYKEMFPKYNTKVLPDFGNLVIDIREPRIMYAADMNIRSKFVSDEEKNKYINFVSKLMDGKYYELWYTFSSCFDRYLGENMTNKCIFDNFRYHHLDIREILPFNYKYGDAIESFFAKSEQYMDIIIDIMRKEYSIDLLNDLEYIVNVMKKIYLGKNSFSKRYIMLCMTSDNFLEDTKDFRDFLKDIIEDKPKSIQLYFNYFLEYLESDLLLVENGQHLIKRNLGTLTNYLNEEQIYEFLDKNYEYDQGFLEEEKIGSKFPMKYIISSRLTLGSLIMKHDSIKMDIYSISKIINSNENSKYKIVVVGEEHALTFTKFISKYIKMPEFYSPPKFQKVNGENIPVMCVDGTHLPF